jgi:hypothetical protein
MSGYIRVKQGFYAKKSVKDVVLPLVEQFKTGSKGGYVTVNGAYFKVDRNIRVIVDSPRNYEFASEQDYLNQSKDLVPLTVQGQAEVQTESDEEIMTRIASRFEILTDMTKAATCGEIRALIVTGPPGVGKSFGVEKVLEEYSLFDRVASKRPKYDVIKGASTALGLYQILYKYSERGSVVVFDDCDTILFDDLALNLLKGALDSGKKRKISWNADSRALREDGIPNSFEFRGSVIFITNLKFDQVRSKTLQEHLLALQSRCHFLDLTMNTERDKFLRIKQIAGKGELFDSYDFTEADQTEILEFMDTNRNKLREMSLRMALKIADLKRMSATNWRNLALATVCKI